MNNNREQHHAQSLQSATLVRATSGWQPFHGFTAGRRTVRTPLGGSAGPSASNTAKAIDTGPAPAHPSAEASAESRPLHASPEHGYSAVLNSPGGDASNSELDAPIFYCLPAADLQEGMSTDDGQDIVAVISADDWIIGEVYTPRTDDPELDRCNRDDTQCRIYRPAELVGMGTFTDTAIDGSDADRARPHRHCTRQDLSS